ncbi:MAG: acyltransferase [Porticoccaceae bacterium]
MVMRILSKCLRAIQVFFRHLNSMLHKAFFWLSYYPNITFDPGVLLLGKVRIVASDGGKIHIRNRAMISAGSQLIAKRGIITIGNDVFIGTDAVLVANESITIGNDVLIAERVSIRDQSHGMKSGVVFRSQPTTSSPVRISNNVWLGASAFVGSGITIDDDVIVGANAVVTKNLASGSIYAGVPALKIKDIIGE